VPYFPCEGSIGTHLSELWVLGSGNDARHRLPVLLRVQGMQGHPAPEARRLLRVLFLRLRKMPSGASNSPERLAVILMFTREEALPR
jgi:hypothetical protein